MKHNKLVIAATLFVFILISCDLNFFEEKPQELESYLAQSQQEAKINNHVIILDKDEMGGLATISPDGTRLSFHLIPEDLMNLNGGEILAIEPITQYPYGTLKKVEQFTYQDSYLILVTKQASLADVIESGTVSIHSVLTPEDLVTRSDMSNVKDAKMVSQSQKTSKTIHLVIDETIVKDSTGGEIHVGGEIDVTPEFVFQFNVASATIQDVIFVNQTEINSDLAFQSTINWLNQHAIEITLGNFYFRPLIVMVGTFPVWITPTLDLVLGIDGDASPDIQTRVTQTATYQGGVSYQNQSWKLESDWLNNDFKFEESTTFTDCDIKTYTGPEFSLKIYGMAGPFAGLESYLRYVSNLNPPTWWELHGGLDVLVGVEASFLGYTLYEHTENLLNHDQLLASSGQQFLGLTPTSKLVKSICPDADLVKITVGDVASIVYDKVNLRSQPLVPMNWESNIILEMELGDEVTVINGPACAHEGTWWKVETETGEVGWVREFQPNKRLIEPIN